MTKVQLLAIFSSAADAALMTGKDDCRSDFVFSLEQALRASSNFDKDAKALFDVLERLSQRPLPL